MSRKYEYEDLGDVELPEEVHQDVQRRIAQADKELQEVRINMRWGKDQLNTVKRVADGIGIPYQTYIKHVVLKQSLQDLDQLEKIRA